ncbi:anti-sigma factor domain-containing protein [Bacillus sp. ISL-18]|uniref:anti-sigma factor domain-containing protein n=1 Tax=Bacillus sp. ISL-18 TaxID=2819118 RepID=UPI001BE8F2C6|nr:anti-sigma factor domain-containing protein [Bacillus sp. ISL-18]MBT2654130.1 anti-sigma factor domain-containing protein [Bacillus sp. ISL-18]
MKKGIIMEIDDAFLTLLTPEGEFLRTKKQDQLYTIGEEIHFFPITTFQARESFLLLRKMFKARSVWAVMAALLILLGSFLPLHQNNNKAYAYMSIDANSSIELGVNKKMQVVKLAGFNKEGQEVISKLNDWKKKDVSEITQSILEEMKQAGQLENNQEVIIATVRAREQDEQSEKELQKNIDEIKASAGKKELELTVLNATQEDRNKAHNLGITTGKYQENKYQSSLRQKEKQKKRYENQKNENHKNENQKLNTFPLSPNVVNPPGQQKKINNENPAAPIQKKAINSNASVGKTVPPGQLKKAENQLKQEQRNNNQQVKQEMKQQPKQQPHSFAKNQSNAHGKAPNPNNHEKKPNQKEPNKNNNHNHK